MSYLALKNCWIEKIKIVAHYNVNLWVNKRYDLQILSGSVEL